MHTRTPCFVCYSDPHSHCVEWHTPPPHFAPWLQNLDLWEKYFTERRDIQSRMRAYAPWDLDSPGNEKWLIHGTGTTKPEVIYNTHGFDWRYSRTTCYFGQASYFAEEPGYSGKLQVVMR